MKKTFALVACGTAALVVTLAVSRVAATPMARDSSIERGRYLVKIAGCNDCHTAGYAQTGGQIPESQWLLGDAVGWQGPWGTTYPTNLRLHLQNYSEAQWMAYASTLRARPPMPWFALHDMEEADLRALYRYIRSLGPAGTPAPAYVPPGEVPQGPAIRFPEPPPPARG
jgi:mono/diheme cytochrome c family protein